MLNLPSPEPEAPGQPLVLRLDPLHNWTDLLVLGFAIACAAWMALGELYAHGWTKDPTIWNNVGTFAPLAIGLAVASWRRFRRVRLIVGEDTIEGVSLWGARKRIRLEDLADLTLEGRPSVRELVFREKDRVAFRALRKVWTSPQLSTLAIFLDIPVPGGGKSASSRLTLWIANFVGLGVDLLFLGVGTAVLASTVSADLDSRAYVHAEKVCYVSYGQPTQGCYAVLPATIDAIGERTGNQYPMRLVFHTQTYLTTVVSNKANYDKFHVGMKTVAIVWKDRLTLVAADDTTEVKTTDNPLLKEQENRSGLALLFLGVLAIVPVLSRLHPVIR